MNPERIREARKRKGITQEQLSKFLGVQRSVISKYETGLIIPSIPQTEKIASTLGVTMDYLLGQDEMQKDIASFVESPGEWVSRVKTNEGVIVLPAEFNEFERFIEKIGYRTTLDNKGQYWIEGNGKRTTISVADLMNLVRSSRATVGALAQSLIDKPSEDTQLK